MDSKDVHQKPKQATGLGGELFLRPTEPFPICPNCGGNLTFDFKRSLGKV